MLCHQACLCPCRRDTLPCVQQHAGHRCSKRRKGDHNALFYLLWVAQRLLLGDKAILHENVEGFDMALLTRYFGTDYHIESVVLDLEQEEGVPVERRRRYTWLIRLDVYTSRMKVSQFMPWSSEFNALFHRRRHESCSWRIFYGYAKDQEVLDELQWAAQRPSSLMFEEQSSVTIDTPFGDVITTTEQLWVDEYGRIRSHSAVALTQNPFGIPSASPLAHGGDVLQTIVRNCFQLYSQEHERWLMPTELALAHGWPLVHKAYGESCTLELDPIEFNMEPRARTERFFMVGRGMSLPQVCQALTWYHVFNNDHARHRVENSATLSFLASVLS